MTTITSRGDYAFTFLVPYSDRKDMEKVRKTVDRALKKLRRKFPDRSFPIMSAPVNDYDLNGRAKITRFYDDRFAGRDE